MERFSTFDLLVLTSLDQLIFKLKILFTIYTERATLIRSIVLSLPLQLVFPALAYQACRSQTLLLIFMQSVTKIKKIKTSELERCH